MPPQRKQTVPVLPTDVIIRERDIDEYRQDTENANRGSERGQQLIETSFKEVGAGRSLVSDADDTLIGGNHAIRGAKAAGIRRVVEIDLPPDVLLVRKRSDLRLKEGGKARRMALSDNRSQAVNLDFDPELLLSDPDMLEGFWREDEIAALQDSMDAELLAAGAIEGDMPEGDRLNKQRLKQIKPVFYVEDLAIFERALASTGLVNRGDALLEICRAYLEGKTDELPL